MSRCYDMVCVTCRKKHWCGQGWPPHLYTGIVDPKGRVHLARFLEEHLGSEHVLHFVIDEDECSWDFEEVEYEEAPPPNPNNYTRKHSSRKETP